MNEEDAYAAVDTRARVAIDLGAESCRVSLLRWSSGRPVIELIHRIPNGPVHVENALCWPLDSIMSGLDTGLRMAAQSAPEGIASIAVDGWAVDYVRLGKDGEPLRDPYCYRDERTVAAKKAADELAEPATMFARTGAQPLRINTVYQLLADREAGIDMNAPWACLPEYVLHRLGGRRVAEYTNATHTGLVDIGTGQWSPMLLELFEIAVDAMPPIVAAGTVVGKLTGELARLAAYRDTELIAPACHDTASAIAGISTDLSDGAYICSGTWSLVGSLSDAAITTNNAMEAGFTNQGEASGGFCFHTNVNGMWILKQCMEHWRMDGRPCDLEWLIKQAAERNDFPGIVSVDAPSLLLDGDMPALLNEQLRLSGYAVVDDISGNEPIFARIIFESLANRYKSVLNDLERILGRRMRRIHILGGGSQNRLLTNLTAQRTGLAVETGSVESSTIGNFAVQLASSEACGEPLKAGPVRRWATLLSKAQGCTPM